MADFRTANDIRNRTLTSQTIYANCIDATKIIGTITGGSSGVIINSSTVVIINASELVEINASTVIINASTLIVNSTDTCINASGEFKVIASLITLTANDTVINSNTTINSSNVIIDATASLLLNAGTIDFASSGNVQMFVDATGITASATLTSYDLQIPAQGSLTVDSSGTVLLGNIQGISMVVSGSSVTGTAQSLKTTVFANFDLSNWGAGEFRDFVITYPASVLSSDLMPLVTPAQTELALTFPSNIVLANYSIGATTVTISFLNADASPYTNTFRFTYVLV